MSYFGADPADGGLEVKISGGVLSIEIGVNALMQAIEMGREYTMEKIVVTDARVFAKEVLGALQHEEEDGTTPVHRLIDRAAAFAIEYGAEGVEILEENDDE